MIEMPTPLVDSRDVALQKLSTDQLGAAIMSKYQRSVSSRNSVEDVWDEVYELYRASAVDIANAKARSFASSGDDTDWHHRVNTGHTFEVVETLVAYFKGATFPSDDWFDVKGAEPELADVARVVKVLAKTKMERASVRDVFEEWVRNLVLAGVSTYRIGWHEGTKRTYKRNSTGATVPINASASELKLEAVSPYDIWLDTSGDKRAGVFTRLRHTREQLNQLVSDGYYTLAKEVLERYEDYSFKDPDQVKSSLGGDDIIEYYGPMLVGTVQFWCVHAVFYGKQLIRLSDSEHWCGSPFVTATLLPNKDSVYGMSVLHPNLGALHILNVLTNSRLDNLILNIQKMWTMVEDGILKREHVKARPGAVFAVAQHGSLQPIDMGAQNFVVTYQEAQVQESSVYRNTSTGPLIGNAPTRGGERVTAAEIQGVRDAGGNRLASVHTHIEDAATIPMLEKAFCFMQQHYLEPETVRMYVPEKQQDGFFSVPPEALQYAYSFQALGATYVVERERMTRDLLQLLDISGRVPQIGQLLDYSRILEDLLRQMRFTDPMRYLKSTQAQVGTVDPQQGQPVELDQSIGGDMTMQAMARTTPEELGEMSNALGMDTSNVPPEVMTMLTQQLQQAGQSGQLQ